MAVELRRRLGAAVGKELPATLAMDHPPAVRRGGLPARRRARTQRARQSMRDRSRHPLATTATDEPIAIIAVACRFPGAPDPEAYWDVLSGGVDAIRESQRTASTSTSSTTRTSRCRARSTPAAADTSTAIDGFDPEFFGISPREAVWIEPQQRLMLETAWEGLERAGYAPASLRGSRTGIFMGVGANEYSHLLSAESVEKIEAPLHHRQRTQRHRRSGRLRAWDSKGPRWRWTPRAARLWSRSIRPARHCIPVTATWRWPVA